VAQAARTTEINTTRVRTTKIRLRMRNTPP
jgi:hypothetical protein